MIHLHALLSMMVLGILNQSRRLGSADSDLPTRIRRLGSAATRAARAALPAAVATGHVTGVPGETSQRACTCRLEIRIVTCAAGRLAGGGRNTSIMRRARALASVRPCAPVHVHLRARACTCAGGVLCEGGVLCGDRNEPVSGSFRSPLPPYPLSIKAPKLYKRQTRPSFAALHPIRVNGLSFHKYDLFFWLISFHPFGFVTSNIYFGLRDTSNIYFGLRDLNY